MAVPLKLGFCLLGSNWVNLKSLSQVLIIPAVVESGQSEERAPESLHFHCADDLLVFFLLPRTIECYRSHDSLVGFGIL